MWFWNPEKRREGFPAKFTIQKIGIAQAQAISHLSPPEMAAYFRENSLVAERLLAESYDKRYSPSTFLEEKDGVYTVGWVPRHAPSECKKHFASLADAATDYLLFSLGKGRWTPPEVE